MKFFAKNKVAEDIFDVNVLDDPGSGIDFTLVDPRATEKDIKSMLDIACDNRYYAAIVSPVHVRFAREYIDKKLSGTLKLGTVIGFPLGSSTIKVKIQEAKDAIRSGADELDVVVSIGSIKEGDYAYVKHEMQRIVRLKRKVVVKAIIETAYLSPEEIEKTVQALVKARVDYIMTSTGYAPLGADIETVEKLITLTNRTGVLVKASGGIKTKAQAENLFRVGVARVGTSRII